MTSISCDKSAAPIDERSPGRSSATTQTTAPPVGKSLPDLDVNGRPAAPAHEGRVLSHLRGIERLTVATRHRGEELDLCLDQAQRRLHVLKRAARSEPRGYVLVSE
jgi:hypothetical protein